MKRIDLIRHLSSEAIKILPARAKKTVRKRTGTFWFSAALTVIRPPGSFRVMVAFRRARCVFLLEKTKGLGVGLKVYRKKG
jgi:hypothetical protein